MLAYLFWHAAQNASATDEYEKKILRFGEALAKAKVPGVLGCASYAIGRTSWLGEPGYEDWAWLEGSWALEGLNERAVSGAMEQPHHAVSQITKHGGFGALYYLVDGKHAIPGHSKILWLSRPRGIVWRDVMPGIVKSASAEVTVWRRLMVLGPATEFAVIGPADLALAVPKGWSCVEVARRRLGQA
jgi:hypothetical protein